MNPRLLLLPAALLSLSACSSLSGFFSYEEEPPPPPVQAAAAPAAAPAPDDAWCQRVAASDRARAQASGFDAATLDRMTLASYRQCRTLAPGN